ncbi:hypothetical protein FocTR4_00014143 [Fusarium oxysporum f. sp. cubense]|uniref:Uncharacterized protein n=1 Tax=Fusarium oxysporum f. sp. cubense TaxID=61366 RepID=A0A5C6SMY3_FUSOC|nr:hypothetical protein FocTR4_00014143 [Fusarium oxysporum f. sp. cubense]
MKAQIGRQILIPREGTQLWPGAIKPEEISQDFSDRLNRYHQASLPRLSILSIQYYHK